MRAIMLISLMFLTGCGGGDLHFNGAEVTRVAVGRNVFKVSVVDDLAEAVRVNPRYAPRLGPIREEAAFAMAYVSGCSVVGVLGDQALITGVLACDTQRSAVPDRFAKYQCEEVKRRSNRAPVTVCAASTGETDPD